MIMEAEEQVRIVRDQLKAAQSRQKSYYDRHHRQESYNLDEKAYLRVTPLNGTQRFGFKGKWAPRYIGPFHIIAKRGEVAYQFELPPHLSRVHDVFHVSQLRRCFKDPIHEVDHETLDLQDDLSCREYPVRILDSAERVTRRKKIQFMKVQWSHNSEKEATWEREDRLRAKYPTFLPTTSESRDEILLSGGELSQPQFRYVLGSEVPCIHAKNSKRKSQMGIRKALRI